MNKTEGATDEQQATSAGIPSLKRAISGGNRSINAPGIPAGRGGIPVVGPPKMVAPPPQMLRSATASATYNRPQPL